MILFLILLAIVVIIGASAWVGTTLKREDGYYRSWDDDMNSHEGFTDSGDMNYPPG